MASEAQFEGKEHAKIYSRYRKDAPLFLAEKIVSCLKEKYDGPLNIAIDAGCGSGQGTAVLSPFFLKVHGMDISKAQVEEAKKTRSRPNITYEVARAEILPFPKNSVQLVTTSCVLHWLERDLFFEEVRRVLSDSGILAIYNYYSIKPVLNDPDQIAKVDQIYYKFDKLSKRYRAPQVKIARDCYVDVEFPFEEVIRLPDMRDTFDGRLSDIVGYINSTSVFQNLKKAEPKKADDYISEFEVRLKEIAGECNISENETIKLYRDFCLMICRKVNKPALL